MKCTEKKTGKHTENLFMAVPNVTQHTNDGRPLQKYAYGDTVQPQP